VSGLAIRWLALEHPASQRVYATIGAVAITAWIGGIAVGSLVVLGRR
jgi:hypothetical protein